MGAESFAEKDLWKIFTRVLGTARAHYLGKNDLTGSNCMFMILYI